MYVHQAIRNALGITVFGSSLLRAEPDLASVELTVSRLEQQSGDAFQAAQQGVRGVKEALRQLNVPENCVEFSLMKLDSARDYKNDRLIGYKARTKIRILVREIQAIETLLISVVEAGAHRIDSVRYQTSQLKELREQARRGAVLSARRKAEVYAEAAGSSVGSPIHIEDINPDSLRHRGHSPDIDLTAHDDASEPTELRRGSITVTAAVMVTFAIFDGA